LGGGGDRTWGDTSFMKTLLEYLASLTVTQGRLAGQPFEVLPWQSRFVRGAFAPGIQSAALSIARGNGKTALLSAIAAATLDGPLRVPRGETIIVASSFEQARIAFEHVSAFLGDKLADRHTWKVWDTAQQARVEHRPTGARVRCIGSDPRRAHGMAPVLTLADEPAQWPPTTGERMVAALRTAAGKQPHSRFVSLGTRPADPEHWFAKALAGGAEYSQCHAAGLDAPKFQARTWKKANPSLPAMPDLLAAIRTEAVEAKRDPSLLAAFESLRLNLGTEDAEVSVLLSAELWAEIEGEAPRAGRPVFGIDLGTTAAQSAVASYWPESGRLEALAAFPGEPSLADRGLRDGVGRLYQECASRGELMQLGGRAVDVGALVGEAVARFGRPVSVSADRWREAELADALQASGLNPAFDARGQGFRDGGEDVRAFRRACADGRVTPAPGLLLRSAMAGARTVSDPAGNAKLAKGSQGGRRLRARDDAAAAAILAVASGVRQADRPAGGGYLGLA
ncbi:MAG: terminase large subunit, partial [Rhodospirillales bacterium]|nr:terminase large subunit [Rhodospirillales bacterium]